MRHPIRSISTAAVILAVAAVSPSCKSNNSGASNIPSYSWSALDAQLPNGSNATPAHNLSQYEYPFDANGRYVSSWAAEGERRKGRSAYTSSSGSSRSRSSSSSSRSKSKTRYHKVRSGDTLWGLSRRYSTTVSAIKRANGLSSDTIVNGKTLKIP
jgi:hypothetical protein